MILLCPGSPGWSYDFNAQAIAHHLRDRFDLRIAYGLDEVISLAAKADLIVDFWWRGALEQYFGRRVVKQVSSHRWMQRRYGRLTPQLLARKHLARSAHVVVPSRRLLGVVTDGLAAHAADPQGFSTLAPSAASLAPKGFHPEAFGDEQQRAGVLRVGWAGAAKHSDKRLASLREAWPDIDAVGPGCERELTQDEMPAWYNSVDVITCASDAEGDPRPLIEGMACGCFVVTVDVGIVPELVMAGDTAVEVVPGVRRYPRGVVVERSVEALRAALAWCRDNVDEVRASGRCNAEYMLAERTWAQVAPLWGDAFDRALGVQGKAA